MPKTSDRPRQPGAAPNLAAMFALGEVDELVRILARDNARFLEAGADLEDVRGMLLASELELVRGECATLDGVAAKLELVLADLVAQLGTADQDWPPNEHRVVELTAVLTAVLDLHRMRRRGHEGAP